MCKSDNNCHIWDGDAYKNYLNETQHGAAYTKEEFINLIKTDHDWAKVWGDLGPVYGKQWRDWGSKKRYGDYEPPMYGGIDQIQNLINDLKTNPDSRRLMVSAWNVAELEDMVLPPCHHSFQLYSVEKEGQRYLSLLWNQRSIDSALGLPFNIASYGLLLEIIAKMVNMVPDELIGNLGDTHLYLNHVEQAKEQIERTSFDLLPTLRIASGPLDDIAHHEIMDFDILNYQSHPTIKAPLSN